MRRSLILRAAGAAGATPPSVYDDATHLWKLDEASGNRAATIGGLALTDNNTVGFQNIGPSGVVAKFVRANSERLKIGNQLIHPSGTIVYEYTFEFWMKIDSTGVALTLSPIYLGHGTGLTIYADTSGNIQNVGFGWYNGTAYPTRSINWGSHGDGTKWHHFAGTFSAASGLVKVFLDGVRRDDTGSGHSPSTGNVWSQAGVYDDLTIGAIDGAGSNFMNGSMSRVRYYERALSDAEILASYNAGKGLAHADAPTGSLVVSADLDEVSGNRNGNGYTLVDVNTVESALTGPSGSVAKFTGANLGDLHVATPINLKKQTTKSYAVWYRTDDDNATTRGVMSCGSAPTVGTPIFLLQETATQYRIFHEMAYRLTLTKITGWNFIVFTYNHAASTWVAYRNGVEIGTGIHGDSGSFSDDYIFVGSGFNTPWDDLIGPTAVWSGVLAPAEVVSLFNKGVPKRYADLTAAEKVNLVSYWNLTEVSGNRADSHGSNTLVNTNAVTNQVNGTPVNLPGRVASFIAANQERLTRVDTPALRVGVADFAFSFWYMRSADTGALTMVLNKGGQEDYTFDSNPFVNKGMRFYTKNGGTYPTSAWGSEILLGTWNHVIGWRDGVAKTVNIQVNGGTPVAVAIGTIVNGDTGGPFSIGAVSGGGSPSSSLISSVAFFLSTITAEQRAALWNNGDGAVLP